MRAARAGGGCSRAPFLYIPGEADLSGVRERERAGRKVLANNSQEMNGTARNDVSCESGNGRRTMRGRPHTLGVVGLILVLVSRRGGYQEAPRKITGCENLGGVRRERGKSKKVRGKRCQTGGARKEVGRGVRVEIVARQVNHIPPVEAAVLNAVQLQDERVGRKVVSFILL